MSPDTKLPLAAVARMPKKRMDHATAGGGKKGWQVPWGRLGFSGARGPGRDLPPAGICAAVMRVAIAADSAADLRPVAASSRVVFTSTLEGCVRACVPSPARNAPPRPAGPGCPDNTSTFHFTCADNDRRPRFDRGARVLLTSYFNASAPGFRCKQLFSSLGRRGSFFFPRTPPPVTSRYAYYTPIAHHHRRGAHLGGLAASVPGRPRKARVRFIRGRVFGFSRRGAFVSC